MKYFGKIIDAHGHIYPDRIADKATHAIGEFYRIPMVHLGTVDELLKADTAAGIKKQLVCSTATTAEQVESINDFVAGACKENPVFFGFGTMHPEYPNYEKELARLKELGLRGIKLHTDFQKFYIDDPKAEPMYRAIADAKLPILFHMGDDRRPFSEPEQLRRVMERIPNLTAMAAHFGGYQKWDDSIDQLCGIENLYFDSSSSLAFLSPETAAGLVEKLGEDRIFYGTDFPMWDHTEELERFFKIPLSEELQEKILWKNFERVFGEQ